MAQPMTCDNHGELGVMYLSTLQGEINTMVLCPACLPDFVTGWAVSLGLVDQWEAEFKAKWDAQAGAVKPARTRKKTAEPTAQVAAPGEKWLASVAAIDDEEWDAVAQPRVFDPSGTDHSEQPSGEQLAEAVAPVEQGEALDEQMEGG